MPSLVLASGILKDPRLPCPAHSLRPGYAIPHPRHPVLCHSIPDPSQRFSTLPLSIPELSHSPPGRSLCVPPHHHGVTTPHPRNPWPSRSNAGLCHRLARRYFPRAIQPKAIARQRIATTTPCRALASRAGPPAFLSVAGADQSFPNASLCRANTRRYNPVPPISPSCASHSRSKASHYHCSASLTHRYAARCRCPASRPHCGPVYALAELDYAVANHCPPPARLPGPFPLRPFPRPRGPRQSPAYLCLAHPCPCSTTANPTHALPAPRLAIPMPKPRYAIPFPRCPTPYPFGPEP